MDDNPRLDLDAYKAAREAHYNEERAAELRAVERRQRRDAWISLSLTALVACALTAYFVGVGIDGLAPRAAEASGEPCPQAETQLNAYERELQQRECEARRRVR